MQFFGMMGVSQSGSTDETERECSMLENNMAGKRFCSLDVFWELDVNLCFGLKAEGKRCIHIEWKWVFQQKTDSG